MLKKDWNYRRGDIYLVDLGEHRGNIQGGVRPVINIQNNSGNFFGPTLIVVPLTTELKKLGQPTHYVIEKQRGLNGTSMSEAEQIVTINKCQVLKYLGRTSKRHMERIDDSIRVSLHLNPEDVLPIPECVEFPWYQWNRANYERKVRNDTMEAMETFELPAENAIAVTEKRCYTVEDLQIILGISRGTVYKLLEQKEFRWMRIGTAYRISKKSFDAWLDEKL